MNKALIIYCILCLLYSWNVPKSQAQLTVEKPKLIGKILDSNRQPVPFATVSLHTTNDSSLVKGTIGNEAGEFTFEDISTRKYYVRISSVGYRPLLSKSISLSAQQPVIDLGELILIADAAILETVVVTAQKPLIEQQVDRTVMNIENSILAEGNTALELLEKAPGVTVDDDGNITLKGKPGATVMINGKLTYLSQKELTTLLRGTSSGSVSQIEVITQPSAKYDAAGNSGIINIKLKKSVKTGLNGSVYTNAARSRKNRYGTGLSLNYRNEKVNVFGSYDHAYRGEQELLSYIRRFHDGADTGFNRISYQNTITDEPLYTNNFKLGTDYFLNASNTIGFVLNGNVGSYTNNGLTTNRLLTASDAVLTDAASTNNDQSRWNSLSYNLNYVHRFKQEGRELTADLDYSGNSFRSNQLLDTRYLYESSGASGRQSTRRGQMPSLTNVYVGKVDYTYPLGKGGKLEMGWKSSYVIANNQVIYDTLRSSDWIPDRSAINHFIYKENIHAGYLNFSREFGSISVQAGLRAEYTGTTGHQVTTDSVVTRNYFQLFPSLSLGKTFNEQHRLQMAYSRRIERPDYEDLNPFKFFRDPFLYYEGNPYLQPQLAHSIEFSHVYKSKFTTTLNYSYTSNVINWFMGQIDSTNTTFQSPQNLKSLINYGISFSAVLTPTRWWTTNNFVNVFHNQYKGDQKGGDLNNQLVSYSLNSQNSFKVGKGISMELSGLYYSKYIYGVFVGNPFYVISAGIQKQVIGKQGTVKFMANDIFQTRRRVQTARYENLDLNTDIRFDSRVLTLSFSYRFGQQTAAERTRRSGSDDVQSRVKGGN